MKASFFARFQPFDLFILPDGSNYNDRLIFALIIHYELEECR